MKKLCAVIPALFITILLYSTVSAAITGTVTDNDGQPVPDALVTFTDESNADNAYRGYTDFNGRYVLVSSPSQVNETPTSFQLNQNFPNPFNPSTTISFALDKPGFVSLSVYNITGQIVSKLIENHLSSGSHTVTWNGNGDDGRRLAAGIYLYQLRCNNHSESRKMLLIDGGNVSAMTDRNQQMISSNAKSTIGVDLTSYYVKITGKDIVLYEESAVKVHESSSLDFVVKRFPGGLSLVTLPGGTFQMGSEHTIAGDAVPIHTVTLSGFEMGRTEVTNAQYVEYLNEIMALDYIFVNIHREVYRKTDDWTGEKYKGWSEISYNDSLGTFFVPSSEENLPATNVTWMGGKAFALYYGLDLPTEEEWEYAGRGGEQYDYATVDGKIDKLNVNYNVNFNELNDSAKPIDVGSLPPNPFELYDMSGNVAEWCNDQYAEDYSDNPPNRMGHPPGYLIKVIRGGSFWDQDYKCRTYYREFMNPEYSRNTVGFRVVRREALQNQ
ncbi:SUMF1/EgtB/PvdO family nonheme iron enzyme [Candidatus Latescibacterota bacterium]